VPKKYRYLIAFMYIVHADESNRTESAEIETEVKISTKDEFDEIVVSFVRKKDLGSVHVTPLAFSLFEDE